MLEENEHLLFIQKPTSLRKILPKSTKLFTKTRKPFQAPSKTSKLLPISPKPMNHRNAKTPIQITKALINTT